MLPSDLQSWLLSQTCTQTPQWGSERGNLQFRFPIHVQFVCVGPVYRPYANSPRNPWNLIVTHIVKISLNAESPCHAHDSPLLGRSQQPGTQFRSFRLHSSGIPTKVCMKSIVPMSAICTPSFIPWSYDRSIAPSKTISPQSAIWWFLFQFPVSSRLPKNIQ